MDKAITGFELGRVTLSGGNWPLSPHYLLSRIYCVKSGWAKIYHGSSEHILKAGSFYFFNQSNDFKIIDSCDFDHIYFNITLNFPISSDTFIDLGSDNKILKSIFDCVSCFLEDNPRIFMYHSDSRTSTVSLLLEAIFDYIDKTFGIPRADNHFVWNAVEIINKDPASITVSKLSAILNINEHHFIRTFKKKMATTPMHYIRVCRLTKGLAILKEGESVESAAEKCGYASSTAFISAFKKQFGISPKKAGNI